MIPYMFENKLISYAIFFPDWITITTQKVLLSVPQEKVDQAYKELDKKN